MRFKFWDIKSGDDDPLELLDDSQEIVAKKLANHTGLNNADTDKNISAEQKMLNYSDPQLPDDCQEIDVKKLANHTELNTPETDEHIPTKSKMGKIIKLGHSDGTLRSFDQELVFKRADASEPLKHGMIVQFVQVTEKRAKQLKQTEPLQEGYTCDPCDFWCFYEEEWEEHVLRNSKHARILTEKAEQQISQLVDSKSFDEASQVKHDKDEDETRTQLLSHDPEIEYCRNFVHAGKCRFGATCKYSHPFEVHELESHGLTLRLQRKDECYRYARTGFCRFGEVCKFHHSEGSRTRPPLRKGRRLGCPSETAGHNALGLHLVTVKAQALDGSVEIRYTDNPLVISGSSFWIKEQDAAKDTLNHKKRARNDDIGNETAGH